MLTNFSLEESIIFLFVALIAITLHELAHGYVAYSLGDPTPKLQGRLTLNPLRHLDPLGTLLLLIVKFGWAKPVEINPLYFKGDRRKGMIYVAAAGPLTNIFIAFIGAILYNLFGSFSALADMFFYYLIIINVYFAAFNLLPVPPLDGSKILRGLLPRHSLNWYYTFEAYSPLILMLLIVTGLTKYLVLPVVNIMLVLINTLVAFVF